jgi:hypothetical protein
MLRAYECGVKGRNWNRTVHAMSPGKAKVEYWRDVREAWPDIPYTAITCRVVGEPQSSEEFQRTAQYRGVPFARVGMNVLVDDMPGVIVGPNASANFDVLFTGGKYNGQTLNCHPGHMMRFFDADGRSSRPAAGKRRATGTCR